MYFWKVNAATLGVKIPIGKGSKTPCSLILSLSKQGALGPLNFVPPSQIPVWDGNESINSVAMFCIHPGHKKTQSYETLRNQNKINKIFIREIQRSSIAKKITTEQHGQIRNF